MLRPALWLLLLPLAAAAQAPPAKPQGKLEATKPGALTRGDEHRVFAQLVEYLHRDTFPPGQQVEEDAPQKNSSQIKTFVEQRRKMLGYIRTRLRDLKADPELYEMVDGYLAVIDEADKYADRMRKHEDEYMKGIQKLRQRLGIEAAMAQLNSAARVVERNTRVAAYSLAGWYGYGNRWSYRRGLLAGSLIMAGNAVAADLRLHANLLGLLIKHQNRLDAYEKENLPTLKANLAREESRFLGSIEGTRSKAIAKGAEAAAGMTKTYGWAKGEVTHAPFDKPVLIETAANPFTPLAKLNGMGTIRTTKDADECEALADALLRLSDKLPMGSVKDSTSVYNRIKADVAYLAATHAAHAAEFQLGGDGFAACVKSPTTAGKVGAKAFAAYHAACVAMDVKPYSKADEKRLEAMTYAYSGQPTRAFNVAKDVLPSDLGGVEEPTYFYDMARLQCLGGADGVKVGMRYLSTAFLMGYRNPEKARATPDLAVLRKTNPDLFNQAVALYK